MAEISNIRVDGTDYDVRDTSKIPVYQGTANAGKIMQVGANGNLAPTAALDDKVDKTQTVNSKALNANITLDANDIPYDDDPEAEIVVGSVGSALFQRPQYNQVVRVDGEQSLTDVQKETARGNIDAASVGEVSDIKSALRDVYNSEIDESVASGNNWFPYEFVAGGRYYFVNTSDTASVGLVAQTLAQPSGYDYIERIGSTTIMPNNPVLFIPNYDASAVFVYATGAGTFSIYSDSSIINHDEQIAALDNYVGQIATDVMRTSKLALEDSVINNKNHVWESAGGGWFEYDIQKNRVYSLSNNGAARFTELQTVNGVNYDFIERIDANGLNAGQTIYFTASENATHVYAYAAGATELEIIDVLAVKELYDKIESIKELPAVVNKNAIESDSAIYAFAEVVPIKPMWDTGTINTSTGDEIDNNYSGRSQILELKGDFVLKSSAKTTTYPCTLYLYNENGVFISAYAIPTNGRELQVSAGQKIRFTVYGTSENRVNIESIDDYITINVRNELYDSPPSYYKSYMEGKIAEIKNASAYVRGITFPFITDVHLQSNTMNSGKLIREIDKKTNAVPFVVFGGDVQNAIDTAENVMAYADSWNEYMSTWGKHKTIQVHGNHDYMCKLTGTETLWFAPLSTVFEYIQQNDYFLVERPVNALYGAVDIKNQKIKIIIADNYDAGYDFAEDEWDGSALMSNEQLKWIAQTVLDSADYHVLFVTHVPTLVSMSVQSEATALKPFDDLIKAARNKTIYSIAGQTFDFTNWTGTVIAELAGHMHKDADGTSDNVLYIGTTCDCYNDSDPNVDRVVGTTTEQAFDIVNIDATNRKITLVRIGGGNNRSFDY